MKSLVIKRGLFFVLVFILFSSQIFAARIGIYPGSFDPVHLGHLEVARSALVKLNLDAVYFIPNGTNPRKPSMSPIEQRAELINAALLDYKDSRLRLFSVSEIEKSSSAGSIDLAPVRLLELARQTFANDEIFQILGTDSVFKVVEGSGVERIDEKWRLAVCNRPGVEFKLNRVCRNLQSQGLLHLFDSFSDLEISSSAIRKACKNGDLGFVASVLTPSAYSALLKQGSHGLDSSSAWLEALLQSPGDKLAADRFPQAEPVMLRQSYHLHTGFTKFRFSYVEPLPEALAIDFSRSHSLGDLRTYVENKLTPLGIKVLRNPSVEVIIFPGNQDQLSHWLAQQGVESGQRITRNRSFITLGIHLVKTADSRFLAIVDEVYGHDRMRHTQALVAAAQHISGRFPAVFRVVDSPDFPTDVATIYSEELQAVVPGTIDAAIIGFHWKIVNDLERRNALYRLSGNLVAIKAGTLAQKWRQWRTKLQPAGEKHSWPRRHFANQNVPFSFLAFQDNSNRPVNVLLTRNVYGDQLKSLLEVLIKEKKIKKIILFGNAGGLAADCAVGDIVVPDEVRRFNTSWVSIKNSLLDESAGLEKSSSGRIYSVFSPLVETDAFIDDVKAQQAIAIDVENGYLPDFSASENVTLGSIAVISDVPGSAETLAHIEENESKMESSLVKCLDLIIDNLGLAGPSEHPFPISGQPLLNIE
ncbi:MAG: adenylyltransferase/cytidyltransferase family protein [Candidatus Riflebacteria bacterium]